MLRRHFTSYLQRNNNSEFDSGYVDLGLSVMWASCNLGASSPYEVGTKHSWVGGDGTGMSETTLLSYDPVYLSSTQSNKEIIKPRTPGPTEINELLSNTIRTEETVDDRRYYKFTATNGNSITVLATDYWTNTYATENAANAMYASTWSPSSGFSDQSTLKSTELCYRGVCSYPPKNNATLIQRNSVIYTNMLYCISEKDLDPIEFIANTTSSIIMNVAYSPEELENNIILTRRAHLIQDGRELHLSSEEFTNILQGAVDDFVYVRFVCEENISIQVNTWNCTSCLNESTLIAPNVGYAIAARSGNTIFRIRYTDYEGYPFDIQWKGPGNLPVYISDTCHYVLSSSNEHVLKYLSIRSGKQSKVDSASLASWETRTEEGYLYVRFNPTNNGTITFLTDKPEE